MHAELEALVCSGPLQGKQQTYALLDERVPQCRCSTATRPWPNWPPGSSGAMARRQAQRSRLVGQPDAYRGAPGNRPGRRPPRTHRRSTGEHWWTGPARAPSPMSHPHGPPASELRRILSGASLVSRATGQASRPDARTRPMRASWTPIHPRDRWSTRAAAGDGSSRRNRPTSRSIHVMTLAGAERQSTEIELERYAAFLGSRCM